MFPPGFARMLSRRDDVCNCDRLQGRNFGNTFAHMLSMSTPESKSQALQRRLVTFATQIIYVSANLPKTAEASLISKQVLRSGTAVAANYGEARAAESRADFIHKLRVVLKELNETAVWLELIVETSLISREKVSPIIAENQELSRIITASIKTAGGFERP
jgi:four helix bundle protein